MQDFEEKGFKIVSEFLPHDVVAKILGDLKSVQLKSSQGGVRNIEAKVDSIQDLVKSDYLRNQAAAYLPKNPSFIRAIYFNKTANNNWLVPWHQDKTIAVSKKLDLKEWTAWSIKNDQIHVQPPSSILNEMVTFRINLDDVTQNNGCLQVIAGSHQHGILQQNEISELVSKSSITHCLASKGSAMVMKPLLVHASGKALVPDNRRVLHIEYSSATLPDGLKWSTE